MRKVPSPRNQIMHTDFFAGQGQVQNAYDIGTDLTTAYHINGVKFVPNTSITVYLDGKQVWQVLASPGLHHHRRAVPDHAPTAGRRVGCLELAHHR